MVFHVLFEGAGRSSVEAKFGTFCGNKQICSHHREDTRCVVTSFISFYLYMLQALWNGLSYYEFYDDSCSWTLLETLPHCYHGRIIMKNYHILSRDLKVLITVSSVAARHV